MPYLNLRRRIIGHFWQFNVSNPPCQQNFGRTPAFSPADPSLICRAHTRIRRHLSGSSPVYQWVSPVSTILYELELASTFADVSCARKVLKTAFPSSPERWTDSVGAGLRRALRLAGGGGEEGLCRSDGYETGLAGITFSVARPLSQTTPTALRPVITSSSSAPTVSPRQPCSRSGTSSSAGAPRRRYLTKSVRDFSS